MAPESEYKPRGSAKACKVCAGLHVRCRSGQKDCLYPDESKLPPSQRVGRNNYSKDPYEKVVPGQKGKGKGNGGQDSPLSQKLALQGAGPIRNTNMPWALTNAAVPSYSGAYGTSYNGAQQSQVPQFANAGFLMQQLAGYQVQDPAGYQVQNPAGYQVQDPASYQVQDPAGYQVQDPASYQVQDPASYQVQDPAGYPLPGGPQQGPAGYQMPGSLQQGPAVGDQPTPSFGTWAGNYYDNLMGVIVDQSTLADMQYCPALTNNSTPITANTGSHWSTSANVDFATPQSGPPNGLLTDPILVERLAQQPAFNGQDRPLATALWAGIQSIDLGAVPTAGQTPNEPAPNMESDSGGFPSGAGPVQEQSQPQLSIEVNNDFDYMGLEFDFAALLHGNDDGQYK